MIGGEKYITNSIMFKFAVDDKGLFGSDYAAAKGTYFFPFNNNELNQSLVMN